MEYLRIALFFLLFCGGVYWVCRRSRRTEPTGEIPPCCPRCGDKAWKEEVNPFTTGIPIGKTIRIQLIKTTGFRFRKVRFRCHGCGFEEEYPLN